MDLIVWEQSQTSKHKTNRKKRQEQVSDQIQYKHTKMHDENYHIL